jgi:hypothetical protein
MITDSKKRATLNISKDAKDKMDELKHTGQSYDGFIQELLIYWEKQQKIKESLK